MATCEDLSLTTTTLALLAGLTSPDGCRVSLPSGAVEVKLLRLSPCLARVVNLNLAVVSLSLSLSKLGLFRPVTCSHAAAVLMQMELPEKPQSIPSRDLPKPFNSFGDTLLVVGRQEEVGWAALRCQSVGHSFTVVLVTVSLRARHTSSLSGSP